MFNAIYGKYKCLRFNCLHFFGLIVLNLVKVKNSALKVSDSYRDLSIVKN